MLASNVSVYKVVAGRDTTLLSYNESVSNLSIDSMKNQEWRGLYTQFKREHVLGTIPYRWEREHKVARLVKATFEELSIVVFDGPLMHDGGVSGD